MKDFQRLLDATLPFIEDLLTQYGEFYPLASAINSQNEIVQVAAAPGEEFPTSDKVIAALKSGLVHAARNGQYTCIALFYDVKVKNEKTGHPTDAIAVFAENNKDNTAFNFFYPYTKAPDNTLTFAESFGNTIDKEIFI